jgi:ferredoxin/Na+-translocating ferredoxin:NAD+ oxidoreductase RnfG subunit|tara:strand:- start:29963 stop:31975 length:2013 start_codon:yes stop_codon:yes gene_type:complete
MPQLASKPSIFPTKTLYLLLALALGGLFVQPVLAQDAMEVDSELLHEVMPAADSFSEKSGEPPVYRAYKTDAAAAEPELIGYLFETPDLPPEEIGYSAPIDVLVGVDLNGTLTGIKILYYRESYKSIRGDFLATERFPNQFETKNVADGFRVGRDVDGVSRATISSWAVARGIRNAARRVARVYLTDSDYVANTKADARALRLLEAQTWEDMIANGLVSNLDVTLGDMTTLKLSFAFMGHDGLGELLVGVNDYSRADREASNRVMNGNMILVGVDGDASMPFRQERLAVMQGEEIFPIERRRFVYVGSADQGKIAKQVRFAGAMVLDDRIDISRAFKILYDTGEPIASFEDLAQVDYQVPPLPLALVQGTELPAEFLADIDEEYDDEEDSGSFASLINNAPWAEFAALLLLLALVMTSFLRKSASLRWVTLTYTLVYLGFIDGTFLSVSHITNAIKLGPSLFLNDLPLLLIVVFTLVTTLFWGRVFCSSLCPFGALQDFLTRFVPHKLQKQLPQALHDKAIYIKYGILLLLIVMALAYSELSVFQYFEPFGTIFYQSQSILLWGILLAFLAASSVVSRFYCRYACPLGAALGVVSLISPWRIARVQQCQVCSVCEHACPTGAIRGPDIDFKECVRCDVCESKLISKAGVCRHSVEEVLARHKTWQPVTVS